MSQVVKIFLRVFNVFLILFLTGCAAQRYHERVETAPASGGARPVFGWPMDGSKLLARYGALEDGVTLKGIILRGSEGQDVKAASGGEVVYVDDSLRGYGKTVVVEHPQGYSSVYARNAQIVVQVGEKVRKGQTLARAGRFGKSAEPQLYFEVRQNAKPVDPELVLK